MIHPRRIIAGVVLYLVVVVTAYHVGSWLAYTLAGGR